MPSCSVVLALPRAGLLLTERIRLFNFHNKGDTTIKEVDCVLCGSSDYRLIYRSKDNRFHRDDYVYNIVACRSCGLVYLNPRPDVEDLPRIYCREYYELDANGSRLGSTKLWAAKHRYVFRPPGHLLDVGCGEGAFLNYMKGLGWKVTGVELSPNCPNSFNLDIHRCDLTDCAFPPKCFDVVTFWSSLEHMIHPMEILRETFRIMKPQGQVIIHVPNFNSISQRFMRGEDVPRHVLMFTPKTITEFQRKSGFVAINIFQRNDISYGGCREAIIFLIKRMRGISWEDILGEHHNIKRVPKRVVSLIALKILDRIITIPLTEILRWIGLNGAMTVVAYKKPNRK